MCCRPSKPKEKDEKPKAEEVAESLPEVQAAKRMSTKAAKVLANEGRVLQRLQHPNILKFVKTMELQDERLSLFTEWISGRTLRQVMDAAGQPLSESVMQSYSAQLCSALRYLHCLQPPVVHRNVRASNIMIDEAGTVKLIGFGLSVQLEMSDSGSAAAAHISSGVCGTAQYLAPEICNPDEQCRYSPQSDIWAVGCTVYLMATGYVPYSHCLSIRVITEEVRNNGAPPLPDSCSDDVKKFYASCVAWDWEKRKSAAELLQHRFIRGVSVQRGSSSTEGQDPSDMADFSSWEVEKCISQGNSETTVEKVRTDAGHSLMAKSAAIWQSEP